MKRVLIVPGAAVRSYVRPAAQALRDRGVAVHLLAAAGEPIAQGIVNLGGGAVAGMIGVSVG